MHFLEIRNVFSEDAGMYTCLVANSAGKASAAAELIVQDGDTETAITAKPSHNLSKPFTVKNTSNALANEQKTSSTSIQTIITETRTPLSTTTVPIVPSMTRTDTTKITPSLHSPPISKPTDGRSPAGQKTSNFVNLRSQNSVKNETQGTKRVLGVFRAPGQMPEPSQLGSTRDTHQQTKRPEWTS